MAKPRLSIIGAGRLGRTLARLFHQTGAVVLADVYNQTRQRAVESVAFIQSGNPVCTYTELQSADIFLIASPDAQIGAVSEALAQVGVLQPGNIVFHCSGALASTVLDTNEGRVHTASIHPIHSFASPKMSLQGFAGSYCGYEGDPEALARVLPLFEAIDAQLVAIQADKKTLYHAAAVMASNYLVTLLDASIQAYEAAGLSQQDAANILAPILQGTLANTLQKGSAEALTGPIARGDAATVSHQLAALTAWQPDIAALYRQLAINTLPIAHQQLAEREGDGEKLQQIEQLLSH